MSPNHSLLKPCIQAVSAELYIYMPYALHGLAYTILKHGERVKVQVFYYNNKKEIMKSKKKLHIIIIT